MYKESNQPTAKAAWLVERAGKAAMRSDVTVRTLRDSGR